VKIYLGGKKMSQIYRIIIAPKKKDPDIFKIINLEIESKALDLSVFYPIFANPETMRIVDGMPKKTPKRQFKEVIYNNAVIDPEQGTIITLCASKGIAVEAAKVSYRYYGKKMDGVYVNKLVHTAYTDEPILTTLKPRGVRQPMQYYDLSGMKNDELQKTSIYRELHLSLSKMRKLAEFQKRLNLEKATDVFLEIFGGSWSEHCFHDLWKSLGLFKILKGATEKIGNPNLVSAFVDNAGVWEFYDGLCILFKLETHNSPSQKEAYGGQMTKLGGVLRDIFENGLGAKPIGNIEMTVVGEFKRLLYPEFTGKTLTAATIGRETIRAIADYGNPMGIPMTIARMISHPNFSGKTFALGGSIGITTREAAEKGRPRVGDIAMMVGGDTGNDGLHGATVSSSGITEFTDTGDSTHVQIGMPYTEQLMMRAGLELRDADCCSARNDFGAHGIASAFGEMGKDTEGGGGFICNLALVKLKCAGLANWQIMISESQERFAHAIKPEKLSKAMAIYKKYGLKATPIGIFTDSGRFQVFYDSSQSFSREMKISGENCFDVPYSFFDECPLDKVEVVEPKPKADVAIYPEINRDNVMDMGLEVVKHFDVCNQSLATTQYDSTVQGITWQGPLYGRNYNIATSLAILKPLFRKNYGATLSLSYSPWQFEVDPVIAAENAMMDVLVTQVIAGVKPMDIALADNFYTDGEDPEARWYLREQVKAITNLSLKTKTPFMVGKDSSAGRGTYGGVSACVLPSVCITGMGKTPDVQKLLLHQWRMPGNLIVDVGPQALRLDGSILSSGLGIKGTRLERLHVDPAMYLNELYRLSRSGMIQSAVPINRGGIFLRIFEGVEASGFGFDTMLCKELFPESFGSVLVEVKDDDVADLLRIFSSIEPRIIGRISYEKGIYIQGRRLNFNLLEDGWNKTFKQALWGKGSREE
jgi:phosphoribosylformylglycinamidine (FGAM) synthase-like enzyme